MRFADMRRKIAARAYADAISLPYIANGAYSLDTSLQRVDEHAALGQAADALLALPRPDRAPSRALPALIGIYRTLVTGGMSRVSGDVLLDSAAEHWRSRAQRGVLDAAATWLYARLLCHAAGLAWDAVHLVFANDPLRIGMPERAVVPGWDGHRRPRFYVYADGRVIGDTSSVDRALAALGAAAALLTLTDQHCC